MVNQEEMLLVQKITDLYHSISKLPNLRPSKEADELFTALVTACIPSSSIDISAQSKQVQDMRSNLIHLCSQAEGFLETHFSDLLSTYENPLHHLSLFPYYSNYLKLSLLEYTLLSRHCTRAPPARVAFLGSGPLPLTSLVLAARHLRSARFHNYDIDGEANKRASALVAADPDLSVRMAFRTADVLAVREELRCYDVVFLAALVGVGSKEKERVVAHLGRYMAPGAMLVVRSAHGARAFLYPVVDPSDLPAGFEVLSVYHPEDDVINSVIVARKGLGRAVTNGAEAGHGMPPPMMLTCKCGKIQAFNPLGNMCMMEEMANPEQIS